MIRSRINNARRAIIIEGIVTLRLLRELHRKYDFHIHVICELADGGTALEADREKYQSEFKPQDNADLVLDLAVLGLQGLLLAQQIDHQSKVYALNVCCRGKEDIGH